MAKKSIQLGDEIKDVTTNQVGIAIGRADYLSGVTYWILQPYATVDNISPREVFVPDAYVVRNGDGVYVKPKPPIGFHAREVEGNGSQTKNRKA